MTLTARQRERRTEHFKQVASLVDWGKRAGFTHLPAAYRIPDKVFLSLNKRWLLCRMREPRFAGKGGDEVKPGEALRAFAQLHNAGENPQRLVDFARIYGVLLICPHLGDRSEVWPGWNKNKECERCHGPWWRERVDDWIYYATEVNAMLSVYVDLHGEVPLPADEAPDVDVIECLPPYRLANRVPRDVLRPTKDLRQVSVQERREEADGRYRARASVWINSLRLHNGLEVKPSGASELGFEIGLRPRFLAGALDLDLSGVLSSHVTHTRCSDCGAILERKPGPIRRRCDSCKVRANKEKGARYDAKRSPRQ